MDTKIYWLSWVQPGGDYRPLTFPPREPILGWWCTGSNDNGATLCALVLATGQEAAKDLIAAEWDRPSRWRFCEERTDTALGGRFPLSEWMIPRFKKANTQ